MERTIYIVNRSGHDFSAALDHGKRLVYLTEGDTPKLKTNQAYRKIVSKLNKSSSEDYLLLSGLSIINTIAGAVFARKHGRLNLLIYKKKAGEKGFYVPRTVNIDELLGGANGLDKRYTQDT